MLGKFVLYLESRLHLWTIQNRSTYYRTLDLDSIKITTRVAFKNVKSSPFMTRSRNTFISVL